jgi:hypothetical protein
MSESIYTGRLRRWGELGKLLLVGCTLAGAVWGGIRVVVADFGDVATVADLEDHNSSELSHSRLIDMVAGVASTAHEIKQEVAAQHKELVELGADYVFLFAYTRETNPRIKEAAAGYYRNEYRKMVARSYTVKDAISESLELPWAHSRR